MFGKTKKSQIDDSFDLDSGLDFDDFDMPDPFAPDDRKPGIKLATGFVKGAGEGLRDTAFLKQSLRDILPSGYGQTMDLTDKVSSTARSIYDESVKEIKPAIKEFKKSAVKLIPPDSKLVPKSVAAMLKRWGEEKDYDSSVLSKEAQQAAMLSQQMNEIFKVETEQAVKQRAEDEGTRQLKEGVDLTRHRDIFGAANRTAMATERLEQYQSNVGLRYQKKSLELQYRQLFAVQDLLGHLKEDTVKRDAGLLQIAKNTALPDYVKITGTENLAQVAKNKFMGKVTEGLFSGRDDMVGKVLGNVKESIVGKVKGVAQGVREGLSGAEQGADMASGMPGMDGYTMAGTVAGGGVAQGVASHYAGKAREKLKGSWLDKKFGILDKGKKLEVFHENLNGKINDFKDDDSLMWQDGFKPFLLRTLQDMIPNMRADAQVDTSGEKDMDAPYALTRRADKSINEIIPGYLSRILREIQIFRTGNNKIELTEFNYDNSTFTSKSKLDAASFKKIITPKGVQRTQENLDELLKQIDPTGKVLSPEARDELKRKLLNNSANKKGATQENLGMYAAYAGVKESVKDEIIPLMRQFFEGLDKDDDKKLAFSRKHNRAANDVADTRAQIQQQVNLGRTQSMKNSGVLNRDGRTIDINAIIEHHLKKSKGAIGPLGDVEPEPFVGPPRPGPNTFPGLGNRIADAKARASNGLTSLYGKAKNTASDLVDQAQASPQGQAMLGYAKPKIEAAKDTVNELYGKAKASPKGQALIGYVKPKLDMARETAMDLYVQGEDSPRIQELKLKLGHYKDRVTGLAIFTLQDVQGDIEDELGNVVVRGEEFSKLAYKDLKDGTLKLWEGGRKAAEAFKDRSYARIKKAQGNSSIQRGLSFLGDAINKAKEKLLDVYVQGEAGPRLSAVKMRMGNYRSLQSGKLLIHQSDIDGPVADELGNTVIEASELAQLVVYNAATRAKEALTLGHTSGMSKLNDFRAAVQGKPASELMQLGYTKLQNHLGKGVDAVCDVFVEGSEQPRLYASKLKEGAYRLRETGVTIFHQDDITGVVEDAEKNTVVSAEELPKLVRFDVTTKRFVAIKAVGRGLLAVARALWHFQTKTAVSWTKFNFRVLGRVTKGLGNMAAVAFGLKRAGPKDVYIGNEKAPRLYGALLKSGAYHLRKNGRVIYHQEDITGEVADSENQVLINDSELEDMKVYDSVLGLPVKLAGSAIKGLVKGGVWFQKKMFGLSKWMFAKGASVIGAGIKKLVNSMSKPMDVLVKGSTKPSLYGTVMAAGGYFSALTKQVISNPTQIDGDVLNEQGETVLREEDIAKGLTNAQGDPIKGGGFGKALGKLGKMFSYRRSLKGTRRTSASSPEEKAAAKEASTGAKTVTLLEEIRTIFKDKFGTKKLLGDADGDGDRDGSYLDKLSKRKAKEAAGKAGAGKAAGAAAAAKAAAPEEGGIGALDALEAASNAKDLLGGGGKAGKVAGKAGKLGKFAKFGGKALGAAGAAYGAYSAYDNIKQGNYGEAALDATGAAAGLALTGTLGAGVASAAGTAAMAIGGGLLSFLASPVVLAVGLTALAGYGLYKGAQFLTRGSMTPMERIRYIQYGFLKDRPEFAAKVLGLETYLKDFLRDGEGAVTLDEKKMDIKSLVSPFGFDHKDEKQLTQFFGWYQNRFKPVFLTHLTAIKTLKGKADLGLINDLKDDEKKQFIDAARFAEGPYQYPVLPLLEKDFNASTAKDVAAIVEETLKELSSDKTKAGEAKKEGGAATAVAGAAVAVVGANGAATVPALDASKLSPTQSKLPSMSMTTVSTVSSATMAGSGKLSAVDAARFKTYGLVELDASKVKSLQLLERAVGKSVRFDAGSVATWQGNPMLILETLTGSFGIAETLSKEANDWLIWFKKRFLPVYMAYLSAYKVYSGKEDASSGADLLKPHQQLELAKLIVAIKGVWSEATSPWPNYKLSSDSEITKPNLNLLEDTSKQAKLEEDKKLTAAKAAPANTATPAAAVKPPAAGTFDSKTITAYAPAKPDAEASPKAGGAPSAPTPSAGGTVSMAGGEISDGRNGMASVSMNKDVSFKGMNPSFMQNFYGMAEEYGALTGKKLTVNDAFRTYEEQVAAKKKYGKRAAEPGSSLHEYGLAMDVQPEDLNALDKMGLMKKYGFTRPVGGEPWHMEPAGIQSNPSSFKNKPSDAMAAIDAGVGRGGGGLGTVDNAPLYSRNRDLAMKLLAVAPTPNVTNAAKKDTVVAAAPGAVSVKAGLSASVPASNTSQVPSGASSNPNIASAGAQLDAEATPKATTSPSNIEAKNSTMPADPTVKVPEPQGSGYDGVKNTILAAAKLVGFDPDIMIKTAAIESGFKTGAKAGTSSASGLFQFTRDTWAAVIDKYGRKYGYDVNTSPFDAKANAIMAAHYLKETSQALSKRTKRVIGATESYIGHFMGAGGGGSFLNTLDKAPESIGATILPKAAASNQAIFYENNRPRSVSEIFTVLDKKMRDKAKSFGIDSAPTVMAAAPSASPRSNIDPGIIMPAAPGIPNQTGDAKVVQASYVAPAKAKPSVATQATDMSESPLSSAYGFKPMQATAVEKTGTQPTQMSKELFATTEGLLSQSVDVQKKMLEVLSSIFGIVSNNAPGEKKPLPTGPATRKPEAYTVPTGPVSMRRIMT